MSFGRPRPAGFKGKCQGMALLQQLDRPAKSEFTD